MDDCAQRITAVLPCVLERLAEKKYLNDFVNFFELVANDTYPLDCIALPCWLDTVKWYNCRSTTDMQYRDETRLFWRVVYKILHGTAIRLFSGMKSLGQVVNGEMSRGELSPQESQINFAVPDVHNLRGSDIVTIDKEIQPGVIHQSLDLKSKSQRSMVLSVDGKKVATGLNDVNGDINLFGFEKPNLEEAKQRISEEFLIIDQLQSSIDASNKDQHLTVGSITSAVLMISTRIKDLRKLYQSQTFMMKKFLKAAGNYWRKSKYLYAISGIHAVLHPIRQCVQTLLDANGKLLGMGATLQNKSESFSSTTVNKEFQPNWSSLHSDSHDLAVSRLLQQRSPEWHSVRDTFPLTGSTLYRALGFDTLKSMKSHMSIFRRLTEKEQFSDEIKEKLEHGTKNEVNGIATLVGMVIPHYFPNLHYVEEGSHIVMNKDQPLLFVSPDGSLCDDAAVLQMKTHRLQDASATMDGLDQFQVIPDDQRGTYYDASLTATEMKTTSNPTLTSHVHSVPISSHLEEANNQASLSGAPLTSEFSDISTNALPVPRVACEIKCPFPVDYKPPVHYELPVYYVTQILAEMASMGVDTTIFASWSAQSMTVFEVSNDPILWDEIFEASVSVYGESNLSFPSRKPDYVSVLKPKMLKFTHQKVRFLCEVPSLKATDMATDNNVSDVVDLHLDDHASSTVCTEIRSALHEAHHLCRKKATEILVWLLSDTDRSWQAEIPHSIPVAYAMKGYSLTTNTMRLMNDVVLDACHSRGIQVACSTFDGQWLPMATKSAKGKPLTLMQLSRDIWRDVVGFTRAEIVGLLSSIELGMSINSEHGQMIVSSTFLEWFNKFMAPGPSHDNLDSEQLNHGSAESASDDTSDMIASLPCEAIDSLQLYTSEENVDALQLNTVSTPVIQHGDIVQEDEYIATDHDREGNKPTTCHASIITPDMGRVILDQLCSHTKQTIRARWCTRTVDDVQKIVMHLTHFPP